MKTILIAALFANACSMQPAAAQSINPQQYAERFCQLRGLGVDEAAARRAAVEYSYQMNRPASEADITQAVRIANQLCPLSYL